MRNEARGPRPGCDFALLRASVRSADVLGNLEHGQPGCAHEVTLSHRAGDVEGVDVTRSLRTRCWISVDRGYAGRYFFGTTEHSKRRGSGRVARHASLQRAGDGEIPVAARQVNGPGSPGGEPHAGSSFRRSGTVIRARALMARTEVKGLGTEFPAPEPFRRGG